MKTIKSTLAVLFTLLIAGGAFFIQANAEYVENTEDVVNTEDVTIKLYDYSDDEYVVVADGLIYDGDVLSFSFYKCDEQDERELMVTSTANAYDWLTDIKQYRFCISKEEFDSSAASYVMIVSKCIEEETESLFYEVNLTYSDLLGGNPIFNCFNINIYLNRYSSYSISVLYPVEYSGDKAIIDKHYTKKSIGDVFQIDKNMTITALSKGEGLVFLYDANDSSCIDCLYITVFDMIREPDNFQELLGNTFASLGESILTAIFTPFYALFLLFGWTGISIVGSVALFFSALFNLSGVIFY